MSEINDMIRKLCPDGVEYRKLGEVCRRQKGIAITAQEMRSLHKEGAPVRIFAGGSTYADVNFSDVSSYHTGESVVVKSRGNIGFEYVNTPFTHKNEMWSYCERGKDEVCIKFVYYYLQNNALYFQTKAKSGKLPQISTPDTDNFEIPVPPLEVQRKIVEYLDNFSELTAELTAELEARRKQYEYYRENLLNFNRGGKVQVK